MKISSSITDVSGIKVGHETNVNALTGCTVILCEDGAVGGAISAEALLAHVRRIYCAQCTWLKKFMPSYWQAVQPMGWMQLPG